MNIKRHIPNFITSLNVLCGTLSIIAVFRWNLQIAAGFIFLGAIFDFFDGFAARLLKVSGAFGKELDSLCDVVTFGVAPSMIVYQMMLESFGAESWVPFLAALIPVFSALRLAKFNLDERQTTGFIGFPTPANALFFAGFTFVDATFLPVLFGWQWLLPILTVLFSLFLVSEIPLMSLKFKSFGFKENAVRYIFLICALLMILFFRNNALPLIILTYIIISLISNIIKK